jgi:hypothetical protein
VPVVLLVAAAAILGGVVLAALGRAGQMATFAGDTAPLELDEVSAADVALLRPPMSLWGYNAQATEEALRVIARSVTARDVEIATLRRELADLHDRQDGARATGVGDRPAAPAGPPAGQPRRGDAPGQPNEPTRASEPARASEPTRASEPARANEPARASEPGPPSRPTHAGQPTHVGPPGLADPPGRAERLPAWLRPSEPGTDE